MIICLQLWSESLDNPLWKKELVYNKVVGFHICKNVTSPHALFEDYAYCL